jgi:hypothetical protein
MGTAGILFFAGDAICQGIEFLQKKRRGTKTKQQPSKEAPTVKFSYDVARSLRMSAFGLTVIGPLGHFFYRLIDKKFPGKSVRTVLTKVVLDQTVFSPIYIPLFFAFEGWLEGLSRQEIIHNVKTRSIPTYIADCIVWPPAQTLNFWLVPPSQRVLYVSLVSIGWNVYLSAAQHPLDESGHETKKH